MYVCPYVCILLAFGPVKIAVEVVVKKLYNFYLVVPHCFVFVNIAVIIIVVVVASVNFCVCMCVCVVATCSVWCGGNHMMFFMSTNEILTCDMVLLCLMFSCDFFFVGF